MATPIKISMATKIAESKGLTLPQALSAGQSTIGASSIMMQNIHPSKNTKARSIKLITYRGVNTNNNEQIDESYFVTETSKYLKRCSNTQESIWYFPIGGSVYAFKFYMPNSLDKDLRNKVYCVPAIKDSSYETGYKDYTTSVPDEFKTAFVAYASTFPANIKDYTSTALAVKTKDFGSINATQKFIISFNFRGSMSGSAGHGGTFSFEFNFYPGQTPITI